LQQVFEVLRNEARSTLKIFNEDSGCVRPFLPRLNDVDDFKIACSQGIKERRTSSASNSGALLVRNDLERSTSVALSVARASLKKGSSDSSYSSSNIDSVYKSASLVTLIDNNNNKKSFHF